MSEIEDHEVNQFILNQEQQRLKKQYRGVMICNQPQRWQYSIEQVNVIQEYPLVSKPKQKQENPLLIKQEKKLRKEFKKVHEQNKEYLESMSTIHDRQLQISSGSNELLTLNSINKSTLIGIGGERCVSLTTNRTDDRDKYSIAYQRSVSLKRGNTQITSSDEQNQHTKRSISSIQKRITFADQPITLKEKFDDYNRAIAERNKQTGERKLSLPKIFDMDRPTQIAHLRSESSNRGKIKTNKYYPQEIFQQQDKKISKVMNEQQQMMKRIISSKLDPLEQQELYDYKELIDMEMIDPIEMSEFQIKNTSPVRRRKLKAKRINSAKVKSSSKEQSPQQNMQKDLKKILKFKSDMTNQYFNFMSSLKVIK